MTILILRSKYNKNIKYTDNRMIDYVISNLNALVQSHLNLRYITEVRRQSLWKR